MLELTPLYSRDSNTEGRKQDIMSGIVKDVVKLFQKKAHRLFLQCFMN